MEFPIGKNLFHLVVNPSTSRYPTVDLVQTGTNYEKRVNKKHEIRFYIFHFFWEFSSGMNRQNVFHLPPIQKFWKF